MSAILHISSNRPFFCWAHSMRNMLVCNVSCAPSLSVWSLLESDRVLPADRHCLVPRPQAGCPVYIYLFVFTGLTPSPPPSTSAADFCISYRTVIHLPRPPYSSPPDLLSIQQTIFSPSFNISIVLM
ncbi:hypothetical protein AVEN_264296-1 [Araneus ventricosus]|uniref:Uncharacterized protein n=1 Tax=Araneus ventricosus TaxID=182803 RepID=A0A4Y2E0G4_ARAVE|nr:hypothetical protein AVEN_264296-1 [Araneus ventricosus]